MASQTERLEMRVTPEVKEAIVQAAALSGTTVSAFASQAARRAATEVIREHRVLKLSARDSRRLLEALENPPEPNEALRQAWAEYKQSCSK